MRGLLTFSRGGVHPSGFKSLTASAQIRNTAVPAETAVPLLQHIGTAARPVVSAGDMVHVGQLIGEPSSFISASVHSPITGTVREIKDIFLLNGLKSPAVIIERDEKSLQSGQYIPYDSWEEMSKPQIIDIIRDSGIVGQGGAAFPAHIKLSVPKGRTCKVLIINGAECEPYLTADHRTMLEYTDDIITGIRILCRLLEPKRILIGIEANKLDCIRALENAGSQYGIEVAALKVKYPQGAEKNLVEAILGKEVPTGRLPIELGVINANVGTMVSIAQAFVLGKPVYERIVTVSGAAVKKPGNLRVRVGMPVKDVFEECGGFSCQPAKLICGGPMMGFSFTDLNSPVTKGVSGLLALSKKEVFNAQETTCLGCGRCLEACPMGLSPTTIYKLTTLEKIDRAVSAGLHDCVLCGACAYACPAHIPLVSAFRAARGRYQRLSNRGR